MKKIKILMLSLGAIVSFSFSSYAMQRNQIQVPEHISQYSNMSLENLLTSFEKLWNSPDVKKERNEVMLKYTFLNKILNKKAIDKNFKIFFYDPLIDSIQMIMLFCFYSLIRINKDEYKDLIDALKKFTDDNKNEKNENLLKAKEYLKLYEEFKEKITFLCLKCSVTTDICYESCIDILIKFSIKKDRTILKEFYKQIVQRLKKLNNTQEYKKIEWKNLSDLENKYATMNLDLSQNKDQQDQRSELTRHIIYIINNFYECREYLKKVPLLRKIIKKVILLEMEKSRFYCTLYPNKDITPILFPSTRQGHENYNKSNKYDNLILNFYNSLIKLEESLN